MKSASSLQHSDAVTSAVHSDARSAASASATGDRWLRLVIALALIAASAAVWWPASANAARIKEVATVAGVQSNQLTGYGLVVGLDGTGDQTTQTPFTTQSLAAFLQQNGITLPAGTNMQLRNVAAVVITADLPAMAQPGQTIDIAVSSTANAKSLRGGILVQTPLKGVDGQIYAMAQGGVVVGGAGASAGGSKVQINQLNVGRIPSGGQVVRGVPTPLMQGDTIQLDLKSSDYDMASSVARVINNAKGANTATPLDGRVVQVRAPTDPGRRIAFLADIENLSFDKAMPSAKVIINADTGSIVMNQAVTINACAVAHGNLQVTISSTPVISQPSAGSGGQTVVSEKADISVTQQGGSLIQMAAGAKLQDVVRALNSLGATPQDLISILQAMDKAGALNAELQIL